MHPIIENLQKRQFNFPGILLWLLCLPDCRCAWFFQTKPQKCALHQLRNIGNSTAPINRELPSEKDSWHSDVAQQPKKTQQIVLEEAEDPGPPPLTPRGEGQPRSSSPATRENRLRRCAAWVCRTNRVPGSADSAEWGDAWTSKKKRQQKTWNEHVFEKIDLKTLKN